MNIRRTCGVLVTCLAMAFLSAQAGQRTAGNVTLAYESLNGGGTSFASNGVYRLGGTLGQNHFVAQSTNSAAWALAGFWRAESACTLYPTWITGTGIATNSMTIEFDVVPGNTYQVSYVVEEDGGVTAGTGIWTNLVTAPFVATGTTVVVYDDLNTVTNQARYYLIRCR